jgi:hypothetical protein
VKKSVWIAANSGTIPNNTAFYKYT